MVRKERWWKYIIGAIGGKRSISSCKAESGSYLSKSRAGGRDRTIPAWMHSQENFNPSGSFSSGAREFRWRNFWQRRFRIGWSKAGSRKIQPSIKVPERMEGPTFNPERFDLANINRRLPQLSRSRRQGHVNILTD